MTLSPGSRAGPYEIIAPLGAGATGEVYRARDHRLQRDLAIKMLPNAVAGDAERRSRFEREARVLASLNHPHIASIYGVEDFKLPDRSVAPALVMELVEGETLADVLARRFDHAAPSQSHGLPIDETIAVGAQIAEALEAAHDTGIIHRDLKPANVNVTRLLRRHVSRGPHDQAIRRAFGETEIKDLYDTLGRCSGSARRRQSIFGR